MASSEHRPEGFRVRAQLCRIESRKVRQPACLFLSLPFPVRAARGGGNPRSRSARYKASSHHRSLPPTLPLSHSPPLLLLFPAGKYLSFACGKGGGGVIRERGPRYISSLWAPMFSRVKRGRKIRQMVLPPPSPPRVLSLCIHMCINRQRPGT